MKYTFASKQQAIFLNGYVLLFILIVFSSKIMDTTASFYRPLIHFATFAMTAMAAYLLFLSVFVWYKNPAKKALVSSLITAGQILVLIGSVIFLYYKFF